MDQLIPVFLFVLGLADKIGFGRLMTVVFFGLLVVYYLHQHFIISILIPEKDPLYLYVLEHCARNSTSVHRSSMIARTDTKIDENKPDFKTSTKEPRNFFQEELQNPPKFLPDFFVAWFISYRLSLQQIRRGNENYLLARYIGRSSRPIECLCTQAREEYFQQHRDDVLIRFPESDQVIDQYSAQESWERPVYRRGKLLKTICLDPELKEEVVDDLQVFFKNGMSKRYFTSGIPYRRGYLFFGAPGTGKTSFCKALALSSGLMIYLINVMDVNLTDSSLQKLILSVSGRCILLLEDINPQQLTRNNKIQGEGKKGVSLAGLLGALDGPLTPEGLLIIMTTNFNSSDFPEALIRAGRVDKKLEFKKATSQDAVQLYNICYSYLPKAEVEKFEETFSSRANSMECHQIAHAALLGFLSEHTPETACRDFETFLNNHKESRAVDLGSIVDELKTTEAED